jgi:hypothetical protein
MRTGLGSCLVAAVLAAPLTARAFPVETLVTTGPSSARIDIAVLGEGYTASEQAKLTTDAQTLRAALFGVTPYQEYAGLFNVKLVHVTSNQSGADNGSAGGTRDTALNANYGCFSNQYLICIDNATALSIASSDVPEFDIAIALVNDSKYGGSGGQVPVVSTATDAGEILRHEFAHSFGSLADEYESPYPAYPLCSQANDCAEPNATLRSTRAQVKWLDWIDPATPVPTPETASYPGIGVFEGCRYMTSGIYRPKQNCRMRELGQAFCSVCSEGIIRALYNRVSPIDSASPASPVNATSCAPITFSVTTPALSPSYLGYSWRVDGALQTASTASFVVQPAALGAGAHTVAVTVQDATPLVRSDPQQLLVDARTWNVTVPACAVDAGTPDSRPDVVQDAARPDASGDGGMGDASGVQDAARDGAAGDGGFSDSGVNDGAVSDANAGDGSVSDGNPGDGGSGVEDAAADAGSPNDAALTDATAPNDSGRGAVPPPPAPGATASCSCETPGRADGPSRAGLAFAALALLLVRTRARSSRSRG